MRCVAQGLVLAGLLLAATAQAQPSGGRKYSCWTDEQGHRACGDRVPPESAKQGRKVFGKDGRVVQTVPRELSPEEQVEANRQAEAAAAAKRAREAAVAYDRFLLDTYSSVRDIERARDERIITLDGRLRLTEQAIAGDEKSLAGLNTQAEGLLKQGKTPDKKLRRQILGVQKTLNDNRNAAEQIKTDRSALEAKFTRDMQRYQELRAAVTSEAE